MRDAQPQAASVIYQSFTVDGPAGQLRVTVIVKRAGRHFRHPVPPMPSVAIDSAWCHYGAMKRMNLRDVLDEVYDALAWVPRLTGSR